MHQVVLLISLSLSPPSRFSPLRLYLHLPLSFSLYVSLSHSTLFLCIFTALVLSSLLRSLSHSDLIISPLVTPLSNLFLSLDAATYVPTIRSDTETGTGIPGSTKPSLRRNPSSRSGSPGKHHDHQPTGTLAGTPTGNLAGTTAKSA